MADIQRPTLLVFALFILLQCWVIRIDSFSLGRFRFSGSHAIHILIHPSRRPFVKFHSQINAAAGEEEEDGYERFMRQIQQSQQPVPHRPYPPDSDTLTQPTSSSHFNHLKATTTRNHNSLKKSSVHKDASKRFHHRYYRRDPNDDNSILVDEGKVNHLISLRTLAQRRGDYTSADTIRDELNDIHGVYVWDTDSLWSTSPIAPSRKRRAATQRRKNGDTTRDDNTTPHDFGKQGHDYEQVGGEGGGPLSNTISLSEINTLLAKRLAFKLLKQFQKADEIQRILYDKGVRIHDRLRLWRVDGLSFDDDDDDVQDIFSTRPSFVQSEFSQPRLHPPLLQPTIESLIQKRSEARARGDYTTADSIRTELWDLYQVAVDDKTRTWSIGGDFGPQGSFRWTDQGPVSIHSSSTLLSRKKTKKEKEMTKKTSLPPPPTQTPIQTSNQMSTRMYTLSPHSLPLMDPLENQEVWNLVHDRLEAQRVYDFHVADFIQDHLLEKYNVTIHDSLRQYSVGGTFGLIN